MTLRKFGVDYPEDSAFADLEFARVGHCRQDDVDVYIGRHGGSDSHLLNTAIGEPGWLGNPFPLSTFDREESIAAFTKALTTRIDREPLFARALAEQVHGQVLGCWCRRLDEVEPICHGDVLVDAAAMCFQSGGRQR
jgi:hypothetical protein